MYASGEVRLALTDRSLSLMRMALQKLPATEAIEALRSALDQAGYAAAIAAGIAQPKHAYFPIAEDATGFENVMKGRCKELPAEIQALFRAFKAYRGGNDTLWALNKLRQAIHTTLIPAAILTGGADFRGIGTGTIRLVTPVWDSAKNELEYARFGQDTHAKYEIGVVCTVALGEIDLTRNKPAVGVLNAMADEVERVVVATEAECRRLGLVT